MKAKVEDSVVQHLKEKKGSYGVPANGKTEKNRSAIVIYLCIDVSLSRYRTVRVKQKSFRTTTPTTMSTLSLHASYRKAENVQHEYTAKRRQLFHDTPTKKPHRNTEEKKLTQTKTKAEK